MGPGRGGRRGGPGSRPGPAPHGGGGRAAGPERGRGQRTGHELRRPHLALRRVVRHRPGIDQVGAVRVRITDIGYSTAAPENLLASVSRYLRVEIVLASVGIIALAIATPIVKALFAAMRELRREIGVLNGVTGTRRKPAT